MLRDVDGDDPALPKRLPVADPEIASSLRRQTFYPKADTPLPDSALRLIAQRKNEDLQIQASFIRQICTATFKKPARSVVPLDGRGTFHTIYRVEMDDSRQFVVRLNSQSHSYVDFDLYVDRWATKTTGFRGLPGVTVYAVDVSRRLCPYDYEILGVAAGCSLTEIDQRGDLDEAVLSQLGATIARIHRIQTERFGFIDVRPILEDDSVVGTGLLPSWRQYIYTNLSTHLKLCTDIGAIGAAESREIEAIFLKLDPLLNDVNPVLLHGDPGSHNVFWHDGRISAIIDWEDCLSGDPIFEIAFWGTFHPDGRLQPFLEGYRLSAPLPDDFFPRYWLYYLRVALSKTVLRFRFQYSDAPGRPPTSNRIRKGIHKLQELGVC